MSPSEDEEPPTADSVADRLMDLLASEETLPPTVQRLNVEGGAAFEVIWAERGVRCIVAVRCAQIK